MCQVRSIKYTLYIGQRRKEELMHIRGHWQKTISTTMVENVEIRFPFNIDCSNIRQRLEQSKLIALNIDQSYIVFRPYRRQINQLTLLSISSVFNYKINKINLLKIYISLIFYVFATTISDMTLHCYLIEATVAIVLVESNHSRLLYE